MNSEIKGSFDLLTGLAHRGCMSQAEFNLTNEKQSDVEKYIEELEKERDTLKEEMSKKLSQSVCWKPNETYKLCYEAMKMIKKYPAIINSSVRSDSAWGIQACLPVNQQEAEEIKEWYLDDFKKALESVKE